MCVRGTTIECRLRHTLRCFLFALSPFKSIHFLLLVVHFERTNLTDKQNQWRGRKKNYSMCLIWAALKFWINEFRNSSLMERNANSAKSVFVIEKKEKESMGFEIEWMLSTRMLKKIQKKKGRLFTVDYRILCVFIIVSLLHHRQSQIKMNRTLDGFEFYSKTKQSNEETKQRKKFKSFYFSFGLVRPHFRLGIKYEFLRWHEYAIFSFWAFSVCIRWTLIISVCVCSLAFRMHSVVASFWTFCTGWCIHKNYLLMNYSFGFEWAYATSKWKWPQLSLFDCIYLLYLPLFCHGSLLFWFKFVLQRKIK